MIGSDYAIYEKEDIKKLIKKLEGLK